MDRQEHLLVILTEECAELSKEVSKALRFGLNDHEPNKTETNAQRIAQEFNDLLAVVNMLSAEGFLDNKTLFSSYLITKKFDKVEKWLNYSKEVGTLS